MRISINNPAYFYTYTGTFSQRVFELPVFNGNNAGSVQAMPLANGAQSNFQNYQINYNSGTYEFNMLKNGTLIIDGLVGSGNGETVHIRKNGATIKSITDANNGNFKNAISVGVNDKITICSSGWYASGINQTYRFITSGFFNMEII